MNIIERVKNIVVTPKKEWDIIATEGNSMTSVFTTYVLPLAVVGAGATLLGWGLIGKSYGGLFGIDLKVKGFDIGIKYAIISLVSVIIGFFVTTFVVDALAPSFGSEKNINKSAEFVGYSYTPSLVAAVLNIIPSLGMIAGLLGLYVIYLMYIGLTPMKKTPEDKKVVYLVVSIVALIVVYFVITMILVSIFGLGNLASGMRFN